MAGECLERAGLHINEDHFLAEIVDPETGAVLPAGAKGVKPDDKKTVTPDDGDDDENN